MTESTESLDYGIVSIDNFVASKQIRLFQSLKEHRFSGRLHFSSANQLEWMFFLYLGRIIYATGGRHPVRRWRRNLVYYLPQIALKLEEELDSLANTSLNKSDITWDYDLISFWVQQEKVSREQANNLIRAIIKEILFDITQNKTITYYLNPQKEISSTQLTMVDSEQQVVESWKIWQQWQQAGLESIEPDFAPKVTHPEKLKAKTSDKNYQVLMRLLDGKRPLRDLAVKKRTNIITLISSIRHYFRLGFVQLVAVPDIEVPILLRETSVPLRKTSASNQLQESTANTSSLMLFEEDHDSILDSILEDSEASDNSQKILIACVNNSPLISQIMKKVVNTAGYDFLGESEALIAVAVLLRRKPDIIFIDLEISGLTAYELCSQLRQLSCFTETPILLFSKNTGLLDRMKAKVAGFSEIFHKSMESQSILDVINKYTAV
ncbi:MAG: response regulator [Xenococcus sp. MO_188.B8]|nr:response regulator [Xenococcus sp. MO_188.B8]